MCRGFWFKYQIFEKPQRSQRNIKSKISLYQDFNSRSFA